MTSSTQINFEKLFNILPERYVVFNIDRPVFTMIAASNSYLETTNRSRQEIIGKSLFKVFPDISQQALKGKKGELAASLDRCIETKAPDETGVIRYDIRDANGSFSVRYWRATHYPLINAAGEVDAIVQSTSDITDIVQANEKLELAELQVDDALSAGLIGSWVWDRSKDEFISIASHQLRTPATAVKQYLGMLLEGYIGELTPAQIEILTKARNSNERQLRIVADLLKVAQIDAGKVTLHPTTVDLTLLVKDILSDLADTLKSRDQTIEYDATVSYSAYIDHESIRMVLENIIDNASKYSPEHTVIAISIVEENDTSTISIKDQGVGIEEKDQFKLFEKFSRIDNPLSTKVGGTGLGLYWAKEIVDLHGGSITYKPNPDGGSVFQICVPKKDQGDSL